MLTCSRLILGLFLIALGLDCAFHEYIVVGLWYADYGWEREGAEAVFWSTLVVVIGSYLWLQYFKGRFKFLKEVLQKHRFAVVVFVSWVLTFGLHVCSAYIHIPYVVFIMVYIIELILTGIFHICFVDIWLVEEQRKSKKKKTVVNVDGKQE